MSPRETRRRTTKGVACVAALLAATTCAGSASALPCPMDQGETLYIAGPDSMINVLRNVAASLYAEDIRVYYKGYPSCLGVDNLVNNTPTLPDPAEIGTEFAHQASFWPGDADTEVLCDLPYDELDEDQPEIVPDIVLSDVFATTCANFPNGLGTVADFQGPALGFGFIVHPESPATSISAEAAYLVFGFGAESGVVVPPWTDPATILHRDANSGAENVFAKTIRLDVDKFAGMSLNSTGVMVGQVLDSTGDATQTTIAGANVGIIDANRGDLRTLAYQHYDQTCGYFPDSTEDAFDKRNIRDGHYPIWGVIHILTRVDAGGVPVNPSANRFINLVVGTEEIEGLDPIALEATSNLIPQCAMQVFRTEDGGALASFDPPRPCGCYFESLTGGTACQACTSSSECPDETPECSYGYCEP